MKTAGLHGVSLLHSVDGGTTFGPATTINRQESSAPEVMKDGSVAVAYRVPDPNPASGPAAVTGTIQALQSFGQIHILTWGGGQGGHQV